MSVAAIGAVGAASYVLYQKQEEKIKLLEKRLEKLTEKVKENDLIGKISQRPQNYSARTASGSEVLMWDPLFVLNLFY